MCVKIFNFDSSSNYDSSKPLEEQLRNSTKVVISYEPKDTDVNIFLNEMERLAKTGVSCDVTLDVSHNDYIKGARVARQINKLKKDLNLNEAIKILVNIHSELDKKLKDISSFCRER
jgi:hypothetical protein